MKTIKSWMCLSAILIAFELSATPWFPIASDNPTLRKPNANPSQLVLPHVIRKIPLKNVSFYAKRDSHFDTGVAFSPDGQLLAIGSFWGTVRIINIYSGKILLETDIGEGMVKHIAFSEDGKTIYFGEQSVDANITAMDIISGKIKWQYRMANDLKTSPPPQKDDVYGIYSLPGCYRLKILNNGDVLALGVHSWGDIKNYRSRNRLSRVYRLSPQGSLKWAFPDKEPMAMSMIYMDSDPEGKRLSVLANRAGSNMPKRYHYKPGSLFVLDGQSGTMTGSYTFTPLAPYFRQVGFWQSIAMGKDAKYASIGMRDGRTFVFDMESVKPVRQYDFGVPIMIGNTPVSATATYTHMAADGMIYFQTGNSSIPNINTMQHVVSPPGPHPNANMINAVGPDHRVNWRYKSGHVYQNFWTSEDGRWMVTVVKKEDRQTGREAGAMLFDTHRPGGGSAKRVYYYQFEGMSYFQAAIARDGSAIAVVETPYKEPTTGKVVGTYQVHVIR